VPDVGNGVAAVLGMDNNDTFSSGNTITGTGTFTYTTLYATGSVASADVVATSGDPNGFANAWRVRGPSNNIGGSDGQGHGGNGWALQAPQYTQGAQFSVSTVGYTGISFHFDWFTTTQGVKNLQEQYTLDGKTWININPLMTAVSNGWAPTQTIDFSGIAGASNDPNFGVRLVSAYDPTLSPLNYGSADGGQNGVYNNNSGNWRFADVYFSGTPLAVPEPSTLVLGAMGLGLIVAAARRRGR
jgi:PEP-CTERM motif